MVFVTVTATPYIQVMKMVKKKMKKSDRDWDYIVSMLEDDSDREEIFEYIFNTECVFCKKLFPLINYDTPDKYPICHNGNNDECPISVVKHCNIPKSHWDKVINWIYWDENASDDGPKPQRANALKHAREMQRIIKEWRSS